MPSSSSSTRVAGARATVRRSMPSLPVPPFRAATFDHGNAQTETGRPQSGGGAHRPTADDEDIHRIKGHRSTGPATHAAWFRARQALFIAASISATCFGAPAVRTTGLFRGDQHIVLDTHAHAPPTGIDAFHVRAGRTGPAPRSAPCLPGTSATGRRPGSRPHRARRAPASDSSCADRRRCSSRTRGSLPRCRRAAPATPGPRSWPAGPPRAAD